MTVRPLHDHVVVQRFEAGPERAGMIVIPDSAREKPVHGTVVAAGPGRFLDDGTRLAPDLKAGDTILFGKYSGQAITLDGVEYLVMKEADVLGIHEGGL
jgi:chaperonin GroES